MPGGAGARVQHRGGEIRADQVVFLSFQAMECSTREEEECEVLEEQQCKRVDESQCVEVLEQKCTDVTDTVCNTVQVKNSSFFQSSF